MLGVLAGITIK